MKNGKHVCTSVKCEFYKCNTSMSVYCSGIPEADSIITAFSDLRKRKRFMKRHCCTPDETARCRLFSVFREEMGEAG